MRNTVSFFWIHAGVYTHENECRNDNEWAEIILFLEVGLRGILHTEFVREFVN
jgi:hypothetical protein